MSAKTQKTCETWKPVKGQELTFHREFDYDFDRFAVAGKTLLPGKLAPSIVGHVLREHLVCFAIWCYHNSRD